MFQRSGPFLAVPDDQEMLVSSDFCVFEDSRFRILLRFAVLSFHRQNCPVNFQTDSSDFFQSFWNSSLEKESFRRSLKVWNSEVSAILGSSVKYDDVSFKTLANRKLLALPQLRISKFRQFRISKRKKKRSTAS